MNIHLLKDFFDRFSRCPVCSEKVELFNDDGKRQGLANKLYLQCNGCQWSDGFFTSECIRRRNSASVGRSAFDVNIRSVLSFREIGIGFHGVQTFTAFMNILQPMTKKQYNKVNEKLHEAYKDEAMESCTVAAKETQEKMSVGNSDAGIVDCQVSVDGTWQKKGHVLLNGVVTLVSKDNSKCLDYQVMSK